MYRDALDDLEGFGYASWRAYVPMPHGALGALDQLDPSSIDDPMTSDQPSADPDFGGWDGTTAPPGDMPDVVAPVPTTRDMPVPTPTSTGSKFGVRDITDILGGVTGVAKSAADLLKAGGQTLPHGVAPRPGYTYNPSTGTWLPPRVGGLSLPIIAIGLGAGFLLLRGRGKKK